MMQKKKITLLVAIILLISVVFIISKNNFKKQGPVALTEKSPKREKRIQWWREARFGMMVHWGLYAIPGGIWKGKSYDKKYAEWIMNTAKVPKAEYETLAKKFNPTNFNANEWMGLAKEAGMRYLVFTSKHHDGFALYDSKVSDYDVIDRTPFKRDIYGELAKACEKHGIALGAYYSHVADWHFNDSDDWYFIDNPDEKQPLVNDRLYAKRYAHEGLSKKQKKEDWYQVYGDYMERKAFPQIKEILTQYPSTKIIWFDLGFKLLRKNIDHREYGRETLLLSRKLNPNVIINGRVSLPELKYGDYTGLGDNEVVDFLRLPTSDFEVIMTIPLKTWGYRKNPKSFRSPQLIIKRLSATVSKGGNFMLNIGPKPDGSFDDVSKSTLKTIGKWMHVNGEAIHKTKKSLLPIQAWGYTTQKEKTLYLHIHSWPKNEALFIAGLSSPIKKATILGHGDLPIQTQNPTKHDTLLSIPKQSPFEDFSLPIIKLSFNKEPKINPSIVIHPNKTTHIGIDNNTLLSDESMFSFKRGQILKTKWTKANQSITWKIRPLQSASYEVVLNYWANGGTEGGLSAQGNKYQLTLGKHSFTQSVQVKKNPKAKDFTKKEIEFFKSEFKLDEKTYQNIQQSLGQVDLAQATTNLTLTLKPLSIKKGTALMKFVSISFIPKKN